LNLRFNLLDSNNKELVVNGIYKPYRLGKGFVELEGYPKSLNAHLDSKVIHSRKVPQSGQSIKVRIGLNGLGIYVKKILQ
jgi:hypothetical protein